MKTYSLFILQALLSINGLHAQIDSCYERHDFGLNPVHIYDTLLNRRITKTKILDIAYRDSIVVMEGIADDSCFGITLHYSFNSCIYPAKYNLSRIEISQRYYLQPINYSSLSYSQRTDQLDSIRIILPIDASNLLSLCIFVNTFNMKDSERFTLINRDNPFRHTNISMNELYPKYKSNCLFILEKLTENR